MTITAPELPAASQSAPTGDLTPRQIVAELDKYIVGQADAKRCVAVALRNRLRRRRLDEGMRGEIIPKNIIMIGPTGVGKTEIARRLARLVQAPFVKVEATKYTEVGYVGRDVESMVRDLAEVAVGLVRQEKLDAVRPGAERQARERLLSLLEREAAQNNPEDAASDLPAGRDELAGLLDAGLLEEREVGIEVMQHGTADVMVGMGGGMDEQMMQSLREMVEKMAPQRRAASRMTVAEARRVLLDEECEDLLDMAKIRREAVRRAEEGGIIFIDEIDKVAGPARGGAGGPDVSREGVQRDILPIVEGSTVFTKHGSVRTDHVLFIAAGAFHMSKPSDLIPELQGRFPLRVELKALDAADFRRILRDPEHSLVKQYAALLGADGVELSFTDDGVDAIAQAAMRLNRESQNIGARRLHAILERVLEDAAFDAPDSAGPVTVDRAYVDRRLAPILKDQDLSRFIL